MARNIAQYIFYRLIQAVFSIFGVIVVVFLLSRVLPGNPAIAILGPKATPENIEKVTREWGLDKSYFEQFLIYISRILQGDLGDSYVMGYSVGRLIAERLPASIELVVFAFVLSLIIGIPLGILSARKHDTKTDLILSTLAVMGFSFPSLLLGILLLIFFGINLGLPVSGRIDPRYSINVYTGFILLDTLLNGNINAFLDAFSRIIPPALTLAIPLAGLLLRLTRNSVLEVMMQDFVRTAKMKKLPENIVMYKHILRNALLPIITIAGLYFAVLVTGDIVVETIFAWPGLGRLIWEAVSLRDYMVIQGSVLVVSIIYIVVNTVVDILYMYIDPRIRG
ncbi:MAG: ABC transporter permease [Desulfurococcaceae archaeon]|jgi:peptide/nickel transport system permease protein|nr:ABC transporter permease [Desulfurococcaceae archaeon]MCC6057390.1 ABC transporter permease [Desulfurococcaceae archaeon]MCL7390012.1 ABC transporter permease [Candidatus Geocrenenecus arthurdayi]